MQSTPVSHLKFLATLSGVPLQKFEVKVTVKIENRIILYYQYILNTEIFLKYLNTGTLVGICVGAGYPSPQEHDGRP